MSKFSRLRSILATLTAIAMVLSPSLAPAADYGTYDNVLLCITDQSQQPGRFWQDSVGGTLASSQGTHFVKWIESGASGRLWRSGGSGADNKRALLATGGALQFGTISASNRILFGLGPGGTDTAANYLKSIHENGTLYLRGSIKLDSGYGDRTAVILCNNNSFGINSKGFTLYTQASGTGHCYLACAIARNAGTTLITLQNREFIDDNQWHTFEVACTPGYGTSSLKVDNGARVYGTQTGTRTTGDASFPVSVGDRASNNSPFLGQVKNLIIGNGPISAAQAAEFLTANPLGPIAGDPEMVGSNIHLSLNQNYYYCPRFCYFNGLLIGEPNDSDGAVYNWNSIWVGSGHGADDPTGVETVISKNVTTDGVSTTLSDGGVYSGNSVTMTRTTSTIAFSSQVHTVGISGNTKTDRIIMTKNATTGTMGRFYPIRNTRANSFTEWLALSAAGAELGSGTTVADNLSETTMPSGTVAIAQFSSTLGATGTMALIVITKGADLPGFKSIIIDSSQSNRVYQWLEGYNPSNGQTMEMASTTKFYETTSGAWEALAASEMLKILSPPKAKPRLSLGIDIRLGSLERKANPLDRVGFNTQFCLAP